MKQVAITGASGLLGTAITQRLMACYELLPFAHAHTFPGMIAIDLTSDEGLAALEGHAWDAIVHCAAFRSPEYCATHRDEADRLNGETPARIAALAADRRARMIHISTDYVFDGTAPPYAEADPPHPVNYYGVTKWAGEQAVQAAWPEAVLLRIPALYGAPPAPVVSAMLDEGIRAATSGTTCELDNTTVRYPTHTADLADVVAFLLAGDYRGILHASADECTTRYGWAVAIARILGCHTEHLVPTSGPPPVKEPRPLNSHLSRERLKELGAPLPRGFSELLPHMLRRVSG